MKRTIIITFFIFTFVVGCKHDHCLQPKMNVNEKEFLSYWFFKEQSYWIYRLNGRNIYDTMRVTINEVGQNLETFKESLVHSKGTHYSSYYSHSYYPIYGSYYGNSQEYRAGSNRVEFKDWIMFQNFNNPNAPIYNNFVTFNYPYELNKPIWQNAKVVSKVTLETPAGIFPETVIVNPFVSPFYDSLTHNYIKELYLTPKVGTTKIVMTNNNIWELIDYKVEAYR